MNLIRVMPAKGQGTLVLPQRQRPRRHGSLTMNKPISAKDVAPPKVTTGTVAGKPQGVFRA